MLRPLLSKLQAHAALSERDQQAISGLPCTLKALDPGNYVFRAGDQATSCYVVLNGFVCRHQILASGARQILSVHMAGDGIDLYNALLPTSSHSVQVLTPARIAFIPASAMADLMASHPTVARALWIEMLLDASIQREWTANVGGRDAYTRIAHLLCELGLRSEAAQLGGRQRYDLPMTQEQVADATGLTAVHVNRVLQSLRAAGLISREKSPMMISDWAKLAAAGDFQAEYLQPLRNAA